jgi:metal-responsive CopG/Arc/MetJ family transcriptional regulator
MKAKKPAGPGGRRHESATSSVRATISFPDALYGTLENIAKQNKVSLAWVVRDATEKYVAGKWPVVGRPAT